MSALIFEQCPKDFKCHALSAHDVKSNSPAACHAKLYFISHSLSRSPALSLSLFYYVSHLGKHSSRARQSHGTLISSLTLPGQDTLFMPSRHNYNLNCFYCHEHGFYSRPSVLFLTNENILLTFTWGFSNNNNNNDNNSQLTVTVRLIAFTSLIFN